jgi:hypothetical protein
MTQARTGHWTLTSQNGLDSLHYDPEGTRLEQDLGPDDVLVELHAASLNPLDIVTIEVSICESSDKTALHLSPRVQSDIDGFWAGISADFTFVVCRNSC